MGRVQILAIFKNVESEGEGGRSQTLQYSKMWKMKLKPEDFRFYFCSKMWKIKVKEDKF